MDAGWGQALTERCGARGPPHSPPDPPALLPYVPRVPPAALPGKLTATTFALERPCCVFDRHANASDAVWLVVAFANASDAFRNPPSRADVPLYERLPAARSYMTLETPAAAYACSAPSPAILRVGDDTACGDQGGWDPCNGPLPSPGPYRVKFLVMGCQGPKAETRWSDPILLRRAPRRGGPCVAGIREPAPSPTGPTGPTTSPRPCPNPCPPAAGAAPRGWGALPPGLPVPVLLSKVSLYIYICLLLAWLWDDAPPPLPATLLTHQLGAVFTRLPISATKRWTCGG
ncbi:uroplakin-3b-like isoform X1 [Haliaeetus albicilla]|uniref:uroplakin-3b-like isoform X1 n=1 Tax=Haliaeetus albicilla TaxID=8969 RepID=UPI0037E82032